VQQLLVKKFKEYINKKKIWIRPSL